MSSATTEKISEIKDDSLRQYLNDIRQYPLLTAEEERELAQRCAMGDEEAIRSMVHCNLRLVVSVAREYAGRGVPLMDLIQEGSIGLLAAAKKYDYTREVRFSTYASKGIRRGIVQYFIDHGTMIRVPPHTAEQMRRVMGAKFALLQETGAEPSTLQIAERCEMTGEKVEKLLRMMPEIQSLDVTVGDEDGTLGILLEDITAPKPQEQLVREEQPGTVDRLSSVRDEGQGRGMGWTSGREQDRCNTLQRMVLRLHFGMEDDRCHSLDEIGKILNVSKERARQIERQAIEKLKKYGASMGLEDFLSE